MIAADHLIEREREQKSKREVAPPQFVWMLLVLFLHGNVDSEMNIVESD